MRGRRRVYSSTYAHIQLHFDPQLPGVARPSPSSSWPVSQRLPNEPNPAHRCGRSPTEPHPADRRSPRASPSSNTQTHLPAVIVEERELSNGRIFLKLKTKFPDFVDVPPIDTFEEFIASRDGAQWKLDPAEPEGVLDQWIGEARELARVAFLALLTQNVKSGKIKLSWWKAGQETEAILPESSPSGFICRRCP